MSNYFGNDIRLIKKIDQSITLEFSAIGTKWVIDFDLPVEINSSEKIASTIRERVELFESTYSRFRADSLVAKIAAQPGVFNLPEDARKMFDLCHQLYQLTNGLFTPLIGKTLVEAGYDAAYSLRPKSISSVPTWEEMLIYHYPNLTTKLPLQLDFGAIGKGYIIDLVGDILKSYKIYNFCIDAGGDILYHNENNKPLNVGLENPTNLEQVVGIANLNNQSICASAGSRRHWAEFHHIINPQTLTSPTNIIAVWVVAKSTMLADGLTTCLFFVAPEIFLNDFNFEYLILNHDLSFKKSANFPAELFIK